MALRLRIVSDHRRSLGELSTVVFGATGGTIGRAADNDWVLPDQRRYVSSHHARVQCRNGKFLLADLSTNGVYVNDSDKPIGKQGLYALQNGDMIRIGEYEMLVAVDSNIEVLQPEESAIIALDVAGGIPAEARRTTEEDIGASLELEMLLQGQNSASDSFRAVNAFGQAVPTPYTATRDTTMRRQAEEVSRRMARLAAAARQREKQGPALYDVQTGLAAFCRGAGINVDQLPADAQTRMLHLAGQLLREGLLGLKDLDRYHGEARNRHRIELPPDSGSQAFSLDEGTIDDLVTGLLASHDSRRLDAVQWLRERFQEAKAHEDLSAAATRAAFVEFMDRLDPAELEARFERALKRGKLSGNHRAQYWDLYAEFYRNVTEMPADQLPHVFVEAFARSYLDAVKSRLPDAN